MSDLPTVDELGSAGLIDTSAVNSSIFGTSKFFSEQSSKTKEDIYSDIESAIDDNEKLTELSKVIYLTIFLYITIL